MERGRRKVPLRPVPVLRCCLPSPDFPLISVWGGDRCRLRLSHTPALGPWASLGARFLFLIRKRDSHSHARRFRHLAQSECSPSVSSGGLVVNDGCGSVGAHPGARGLAPARGSPAASDGGALPGCLLAAPPRIPVLFAEMPSPTDQTVDSKGNCLLNARKLQRVS